MNAKSRTKARANLQEEAIMAIELANWGTERRICYVVDRERIERD